MQTTTARNILSDLDIAATCGDADCATSDAEMTHADKASVAAVESEAYAAKQADQRAAWLAGAAARAEAARAATLAKAPAGSVVCPCCDRAVSVKETIANGARIVVKHGWKGQPNGATGRGRSGMQFTPKCCPGSFNGVLAA